jgi:hypothetical protein
MDRDVLKLMANLIRVLLDQVRVGLVLTFGRKRIYIESVDLF